MLNRSVCLILAALLVLLTRLGFANEDRARLERILCNGLFEGPVHEFTSREKLRFPVEWVLVPAEAEQIYESLDPFQRFEFWGLARAAEHVDEFPDSVFEQLGLYVSFEPGEIEQDPDVLSEMARFFDLPRLRQAAYAMAQLAFDDDSPNLNLFLTLHPFLSSVKLYDGLPSTFPFSENEIELNDEDLAWRLRCFLVKHKKDRMKVGAYMGASPFISSLIIRLLSREYLLEDGFAQKKIETLEALWKEHAKGLTPQIPAHLTKTFATLVSYAEQEPFKEASQRWLMPRSASRLIFLSLVGMVDHFTASLQSSRHPFKNSIDTFEKWVVFLRKQVTDDPVLLNLLKKIFIEAVLKRPTASAYQVKQTLRRNLERRFRQIRKDYRLAMAPPPPLPARESPQPSPPKRPLISRHQQKREEYAQLRKHQPQVSKVASLPAAASELEEIIYEVHLAPSGLAYRLALSQSVIEELKNRNRKELPDYKHWYEALQLGPAGNNGKKGWNKLVPAQGTYNWSIKLKGSRWRLLGRRDRERIWRFEKFDLL